MIIPVLVFISFLGVTLISYLLLTRKAAAEQKLLQARISEVLLNSSKSQNPALRLVREDLLSEIPRLNQLLLHLQIATRIRKMVEQADMDLTVMRLTLISAFSGLFASLMFMLFGAPPLLILIIGLVAFSLPFAYVNWKRKKRFHAFLSLLPDTLELMARALSAGHSFTESLHMVATEMPEPIAGEFRKTYEEQNLGLSYKLALKNLTTRVPLLDLRLCVTAILIQRETGGNLAEILEKVAHTIRERFRILEDLKTLTTSSRMSAWLLCALPIGIAAMVQFLSPQYLEVLWYDPRGQRLVYIAAGMQITGMLIIRKIMRIKI